MARKLEKQHVAEHHRLFVVQETDEGGSQFVDGVRRRLSEVGWSGDLRVIAMEGLKAKDPNDLWKKASDDFKALFEALMDHGKPLAVEAEESDSPAPHTASAILNESGLAALGEHAASWG